MVVTGAAAADGLDRASCRLPGHFFSVYDGHGGKDASGWRSKGGDTELLPARQGRQHGAPADGGGRHWRPDCVFIFLSGWYL
jgi:hypothetical protein